MAEILNKSLVSLSFADNPSLNIVAEDLLDSMVSISYGGENFNEISGAFGTTLSPNFYKRATITINMSSISAKYSVWKNQILSNGYVSGGATLRGDNNETFNMRKIRIDFSDSDFNGQSGAGVFTVTCDLRVNTDLLA